MQFVSDFPSVKMGGGVFRLCPETGTGGPPTTAQGRPVALPSGPFAACWFRVPREAVGGDAAAPHLISVSEFQGRDTGCSFEWYVGQNRSLALTLRPDRLRPPASTPRTFRDNLASLASRHGSSEVASRNVGAVQAKEWDDKRHAFKGMESCRGSLSARVH